MLQHYKGCTAVTISKGLPRSFSNLLFFTQACCELLICWWS